MKLLTLKKTVTTTYDLVELEVPDSFTIKKEVKEQIISEVTIKENVKLPEVKIEYTIKEVL